MKKYNYAVVIGRFQHFHNGHKFLIDKAIEVANKVLILVYCPKNIDINNPFIEDTVLKCISKIYDNDENILIKTIYNKKYLNWGEYVLSNIKEHIKREPCVIICGKENKRIKWFKKEETENIDILEYDLINSISATKIRDYLLADKYDLWKENVDKKIFNMYGYLKKRLRR